MTKYSWKRILAFWVILFACGAVAAYIIRTPSHVAGIPVVEICMYENEFFQNAETASRWTGNDPSNIEAEMLILAGLDRTTEAKFHARYGKDIDTVWIEWTEYVVKYGFHVCND